MPMWWPKLPLTAEDEQRRFEIRRLLGFLCAALIGGFAVSAMALRMPCLTSVCAAAKPNSLYTSALGVAWLVAGASGFIGALAGFLFGLPRSASPLTTTGSDKDAKHESVKLRANTSLEEISDWLTKILLGAGLVQMEAIGRGLWTLAGRIGDIGFYQASSGQIVALAVIVYFAIVGLIFSYLITRLYLTRKLAKVDSELGALEQATKRLSDHPIEPKKGEGKFTTPPPSTESMVAADELIRFKLYELDSVDQIIAWSRAQVLKDNYADAVRGFQVAVAERPGDPELRRELGVVLGDAGEAGRAIKELDAALQAAEKAGDSSAAKRIRLDLILYLLYAPRGYSRAIKMSEEWLEKGDIAYEGRVLAHLACAYGQLATDLARQGKHMQNEEFQHARKRALETVKKLFENDGVEFRAWRAIVKMTWDKYDSEKANEDSDLEVFFEDEEFKKVFLQVSTST